MKKIGILSIHAAHNFGSVLQAYALQETLRKYSKDVEMINYRPNYFEYQYKLFSFRIYKDYHGVADKFIHFAWRTLLLPTRYKKWKKFEEFISQNYSLSSKKYTSYRNLCGIDKIYDTVFVGSDQVWNTDITNGFDRSYYLEFLPADTTRASYAASIARKTIDRKYINDYKRAINNLDFISVREKSGETLLREVTDKPITTSIDPTLLLDKTDWQKIAKQSKLNIQHKYIFVYVLQDNDELTKIVNKISKTLQLPVISASKKKRFDNETILPGAGPQDFLYLMEHASFVITNSFHGTAFSTIFEKPNCIVPHKTTGCRMIELMHTLGLDSRVVQEYKNLDLTQIVKQPDYQSAKIKLAKEQSAAHNYIEKVLANHK